MWPKKKQNHAFSTRKFEKKKRYMLLGVRDLHAQISDEDRKKLHQSLNPGLPGFKTSLLKPSLLRYIPWPLVVLIIDYFEIDPFTHSSQLHLISFPFYLDRKAFVSALLRLDNHRLVIVVEREETGEAEEDDTYLMHVWNFHSLRATTFACSECHKQGTSMWLSYKGRRFVLNADDELTDVPVPPLLHHSSSTPAPRLNQVFELPGFTVHVHRDGTEQTRVSVTSATGVRSQDIRLPTSLHPSFDASYAENSYFIFLIPPVLVCGFIVVVATHTIVAYGTHTQQWITLTTHTTPIVTFRVLPLPLPPGDTWLIYWISKAGECGVLDAAKLKLLETDAEALKLVVRESGVLDARLDALTLTLFLYRMDGSTTSIHFLKEKDSEDSEAVPAVPGVPWCLGGGAGSRGCDESLFLLWKSEEMVVVASRRQPVMFYSDRPGKKRWHSHSLKVGTWRWSTCLGNAPLSLAFLSDTRPHHTLTLCV